MQNSFIWWKVYCFSPNIGGSEKASSVVWHWWLWKEPIVLLSGKQRHSKCSKWPRSARIYASSLFCHWLIASSTTLLKFSACLDNLLPQLVHIADCYLISYTLLHHTPDAAINRAEVMTVGWPHVGTDELGCLTAQELDCVTSMMCWRVVLEEDKHVSSKQCCVLLAAALASATRLNSTVQVTVSKQLWLSCTVTVAVHFILR